MTPQMVLSNNTKMVGVKTVCVRHHTPTSASSGVANEFFWTKQLDLS